jgi:hypothetical protein
MSNVPLDRIVTTASIRLVGALSTTILYELFSVVDELLKETGLWKDDLSFNTVVGKLNYNVAAPAGQILRLSYVTDAGGGSQWATMPTPGQIILGLAPATVQAYVATVVLSVVDPVTRDAYPLLPKWIATKYNGVILDGILGHMMSQSSKPYTNEQLAVYHLRRFRSGIAVARADALHNHTEGNQSWSFPQAFATKRRN